MRQPKTAVVRSIEPLPDGTFRVTAEAEVPEAVSLLELDLEPGGLQEEEAGPVDQDPLKKLTGTAIAPTRPLLRPGDCVRVIWRYQ